MKIMHPSKLIIGSLGLFLTGQVSAIVTVSSLDADALASSLLGSGVTIVPGSASLIGGPTSAGFFSSGSTVLSFNDGIVLTSGSVDNIGNSNTSSSISTNFGGSGDSDLTALAGVPTNDATILQFDFTFDPGEAGNLFFEYAFGSDEYNEFVGTNLNDVFGFFLNGSNIALLPGSLDPVSINTVNNGANAAFFNDNAGGAFPFEYDGFTTPLTATAMGLDTGATHTIKLAIADGGDNIYDSGVFIRGNSFGNVDTSVPDGGSSLVLLGLSLAGFFGARRALLK